MTVQPPFPTRSSEPRLLSIHVDPANPNHHLWLNHGTWFIHYMAYGPDLAGQRVRRSLKTRCVIEARRKRDAFFAACRHLGGAA